jgi:hypothetical protein
MKIHYRSDYRSDTTAQVDNIAEEYFLNAHGAAQDWIPMDILESDFKFNIKNAFVAGMKFAQSTWIKE